MSPWYQAWMARHATLFGLVSDAFLETVASWEPIFSAAGYTEKELRDASTWLVTNAPPKNQWDHLGAITGRIRSQRAVHYRQEADASENDWGTCTLCGGSGRVIAPNLNGVRSIEGVQTWVPIKHARGGASYYTYAVVCTCSLGNWFASRQGERVMLTLTQYEQANPRWKIQMAQRAAEQRAWMQFQSGGKLLPSEEALLAQYNVREPGMDEEPTLVAPCRRDP